MDPERFPQESRWRRRTERLLDSKLGGLPDHVVITRIHRIRPDHARCWDLNVQRRRGTPDCIPPAVAMSCLASLVSKPMLTFPGSDNAHLLRRAQWALVDALNEGIRITTSAVMSFEPGVELPVSSLLLLDAPEDSAAHARTLLAALQPRSGSGLFGIPGPSLKELAERATYPMLAAWLDPDLSEPDANLLASWMLPRVARFLDAITDHPVRRQLVHHEEIEPLVQMRATLPRLLRITDPQNGG